MDYNLSTTWTIILAVGVIWEFIWKGIALWKAARSNQQGWFVALLIVNSIGILPIIYLFAFKDHHHEND